MTDKKLSKKNTKRYSISLTERNHEQLLAMSEHTGYASLSEAMRGCIQIAFNKTFPPYKVVAKGATENMVDGKVLSDTEMKEKKEIEEQAKLEAEEQNRINETIRVCEQDLNGVVMADANGNPTDCAFFQYSRVNRTLQNCGLDQVQAMVGVQYQPNKQFVENAQREGRVKYDVGETITEVLAQE
jgi:hypothetical protein